MHGLAVDTVTLPIAQLAEPAIAIETTYYRPPIGHVEFFGPCALAEYLNRWSHSKVNGRNA